MSLPPNKRQRQRPRPVKSQPGDTVQIVSVVAVSDDNGMVGIETTSTGSQVYIPAEIETEMQPSPQAMRVANQVITALFLNDYDPSSASSESLRDQLARTTMNKSGFGDVVRIVTRWATNIVRRFLPFGVHIAKTLIYSHLANMMSAFIIRQMSGVPRKLLALAAPNIVASVAGTALNASWNMAVSSSVAKSILGMVQQRLGAYQSISRRTSRLDKIIADSNALASSANRALLTTVSNATLASKSVLDTSSRFRTSKTSQDVKSQAVATRRIMERAKKALILSSLQAIQVAIAYQIGSTMSDYGIVARMDGIVANGVAWFSSQQSTNAAKGVKELLEMPPSSSTPEVISVSSSSIISSNVTWIAAMVGLSLASSYNASDNSCYYDPKPMDIVHPSLGTRVSPLVSPPKPGAQSSTVERLWKATQACPDFQRRFASVDVVKFALAIVDKFSNNTTNKSRTPRQRQARGIPPMLEAMKRPPTIGKIMVVVLPFKTTLVESDAIWRAGNAAHHTKTSSAMDVDYNNEAINIMSPLLFSSNKSIPEGEHDAPTGTTPQSRRFLKRIAESNYEKSVAGTRRRLLACNNDVERQQIANSIVYELSVEICDEDLAAATIAGGAAEFGEDDDAVLAWLRMLCGITGREPLPTWLAPDHTNPEQRYNTRWLSAFAPLMSSLGADNIDRRIYDAVSASATGKLSTLRNKTNTIIFDEVAASLATSPSDLATMAKFWNNLVSSKSMTRSVANLMNLTFALPRPSLGEAAILDRPHDASKSSAFVVQVISGYDPDIFLCPGPRLAALNAWINAPSSCGRYYQSNTSAAFSPSLCFGNALPSPKSKASIHALVTVQRFDPIISGQSFAGATAQSVAIGIATSSTNNTPWQRAATGVMGPTLFSRPLPVIMTEANTQTSGHASFVIGQGHAGDTTRRTHTRYIPTLDMAMACDIASELQVTFGVVSSVERHTSLYHRHDVIDMAVSMSDASWRRPSLSQQDKQVPSPAQETADIPSFDDAAFASSFVDGYWAHHMPPTTEVIAAFFLQQKTALSKALAEYARLCDSVSSSISSSNIADWRTASPQSVASIRSDEDAKSQLRLSVNRFMFSYDTTISMLDSVAGAISSSSAETAWLSSQSLETIRRWNQGKTNTPNQVSWSSQLTSLTNDIFTSSAIDRSDRLTKFFGPPDLGGHGLATNWYALPWSPNQGAAVGESIPLVHPSLVLLGLDKSIDPILPEARRIRDLFSASETATQLTTRLATLAATPQEDEKLFATDVYAQANDLTMFAYCAQTKFLSITITCLTALIKRLAWDAMVKAGNNLRSFDARDWANIPIVLPSEKDRLLPLVLLTPPIYPPSMGEWAVLLGPNKPGPPPTKTQQKTNSSSKVLFVTPRLGPVVISRFDTCSPVDKLVQWQLYTQKRVESLLSAKSIVPIDSPKASPSQAAFLRAADILASRADFGFWVVDHVPHMIAESIVIVRRGVASQPPSPDVTTVLAQIDQAWPEKVFEPWPAAGEEEEDDAHPVPHNNASVEIFGNSAADVRLTDSVNTFDPSLQVPSSQFDWSNAALSPASVDAFARISSQNTTPQNPSLYRLDHLGLSGLTSAGNSDDDGASSRFANAVIDSITGPYGQSLTVSEFTAMGMAMDDGFQRIKATVMWRSKMAEGGNLMSNSTAGLGVDGDARHWFLTMVTSCITRDAVSSFELKNRVESGFGVSTLLDSVLSGNTRRPMGIAFKASHNATGAFSSRFRFLTSTDVGAWPDEATIADQVAAFISELELASHEMKLLGLGKSITSPNANNRTMSIVSSAIRWIRQTAQGMRSGFGQISTFQQSQASARLARAQDAVAYTPRMSSVDISGAASTIISAGLSVDASTRNTVYIGTTEESFLGKMTIAALTKAGTVGSYAAIADPIKGVASHVAGGGAKGVLASWMTGVALNATSVVSLYKSTLAASRYINTVTSDYTQHELALGLLLRHALVRNILPLGAELPFDYTVDIDIPLEVDMRDSRFMNQLAITNMRRMAQCYRSFQTTGGGGQITVLLEFASGLASFGAKTKYTLTMGGGARDSEDDGGGTLHDSPQQSTPILSGQYGGISSSIPDTRLNMFGLTKIITSVLGAAVKSIVFSYASKYAIMAASSAWVGSESFVHFLSPLVPLVLQGINRTVMWSKAFDWIRDSSYIAKSVVDFARGDDTQGLTLRDVSLSRLLPVVGTVVKGDFIGTLCPVQTVSLPSAVKETEAALPLARAPILARLRSPRANQAPASSTAIQAQQPLSNAQPLSSLEKDASILCMAIVDAMLSDKAPLRDIVMSASKNRSSSKTLDELWADILAEVAKVNAVVQKILISPSREAALDAASMLDAFDAVKTMAAIEPSVVSMVPNQMTLSEYTLVMRDAAAGLAYLRVHKVPHASFGGYSVRVGLSDGRGYVTDYGASPTVDSEQVREAGAVNDDDSGASYDVKNFGRVLASCGSGSVLGFTPTGGSNTKSGEPDFVTYAGVVGTQYTFTTVKTSSPLDRILLQTCPTAVNADIAAHAVALLVHTTNPQSALGPQDADLAKFAAKVRPAQAPTLLPSGAAVQPNWWKSILPTAAHNPTPQDTLFRADPSLPQVVRILKHKSPIKHATATRAIAALRDLASQCVLDDRMTPVAAFIAMHDVACYISTMKEMDRMRLMSKDPQQVTSVGQAVGGHILNAITTSEGDFPPMSVYACDIVSLFGPALTRALLVIAINGLKSEVDGKLVDKAAEERAQKEVDYVIDPRSKEIVAENEAVARRAENEQAVRDGNVNKRPGQENTYVNGENKRKAAEVPVTALPQQQQPAGSLSWVFTLFASESPKAKEYDAVTAESEATMDMSGDGAILANPPIEERWNVKNQDIIASGGDDFMPPSAPGGTAEGASFAVRSPNAPTPSAWGILGYALRALASSVDDGDDDDASPDATQEAQLQQNASPTQRTRPGTGVTRNIQQQQGQQRQMNN